ncbi:hypothetical protein HRG_002849 [Hirsutella rhossiliensis]|uniref:Uncharacterized protein n=1 Tax=Hirsutella rhossiliensis TaxID=111463 RepID=A0A9P8SJ22_9HYPO|nr:uncharacterized protein HRG_02849 [Hirsutella rhossiliensis]KAH0964833.1 hypothetical protein HRG_02849 [Hirsutella rhossiliensis]
MSQLDAPGFSIDPRSPSVLPYSCTFYPTLNGALSARRLLEHRLPPELAVAVVFLGYSPWLLKRRVEERRYNANDFWMPGPRASVAGLYLSTERIPTDIGPVIPQRIIFQTRAADQGWATFGGNGTFDNNHTWFEASILQPSCRGGVGDDPRSVALEDDNVLSNPWENAESARQALRDKGWDFVETEDGQITWRVCSNITARSDYRNYRVEWQRGVKTEVDDERAVGKGEGFLELLEPGCIVVLWARAEQQLWVNHVAAASIEIEYGLL